MFSKLGKHVELQNSWNLFFACDATTTMFAAPVKVDVETANIALPS